MFNRVELKLKARKVLNKDYWRLFAVTALTGIIIGIPCSTSSLIKIGSLIFPLSFWFILLGAPIGIGVNKYYINASKGCNEFNDILMSFKGKHYLNVVIVNFLTSLIIFMWSLLFIVPGIVKFYAYRMVSYILAENPEIDYMEAMKLSEKMTKGYKFDIFILDLSFIGWRLIGFLAFVIGMIFVEPYINSTNVELYFKLKENIENLNTKSINE